MADKQKPPEGGSICPVIVLVRDIFRFPIPCKPDSYLRARQGKTSEKATRIILNNQQLAVLFYRRVWFLETRWAISLYSGRSER